MKKNKTDRRHRIKQVMAGMALALMVAGICIPALAGDQKIRGEWILPEYYPGGFDGYGYINRIAPEEAVIDDLILKLSPAIAYATLYSKLATSYDFAEGDLVGYLVNSEQEVISLWMIEKGGF